MLFAACLFGIGIVLLLWSTSRFVGTAERMALSGKISPLVIGTTVIAVGTSLPELAVSTVASLRGDAGLAVGNIVGSNIVNLTLVMAIGVFAGDLKIGTVKTQRNAWLMGTVTTLFFLLYLLRIPHVPAGIMLILCTAIVTLMEYAWAVRGRTGEDAQRFGKTPKRKAGDLLFILLSMAGIMTGGTVTVMAAERISAASGFSTTLFGLTAMAIATSLPELFTTLFSQRNGDGKLTVGNILGSNIYNLTLIGGISVLVADWGTPVSSEYLMMAVTTVISVAILTRFRGKTIPKRTGILLLGLFGAYLILLS